MSLLRAICLTTLFNLCWAAVCLALPEKGGESAAGLPENILSDKEISQLDDLLKSLNMTRKDTEFDKKLAPSRYMPEIVVQLMDHPLQTPQVTYSHAKLISENRGDPYALFKQALDLWEFKLKFEIQLDTGSSPAESLSKAESWQDIPAPLTNSLAMLYHALAKAERHQNRAFEKLTAKEQRQLLANCQQMIGISNSEMFFPADEWESLQIEESSELYDLLDKINWQEYALGAAWVFAATSQVEKDVVAWLNTASAPEIDVKLDTPMGRIVVGGAGDQDYQEDCLIIIDLAGNDTYKCRAGSAIGGGYGTPISVVMDFGGDDLYLSAKNFSIGGALLGIALHIDCAGDDFYKSSSCSQGCGLVGFGCHIDRRGTDQYLGLEAVQGAGIFGIGIASDDEGNDNFRAARYAQGFAGVRGVGILTTGTGNDIYYAGGEFDHAPLLPDRFQCLSQGFSIGDRYGRAAGGVGILHDVKGNDRYLGDVFAQGGAYWYALGILADEDGNDDYVTTQYSQGSGIHLAVGSLLDLAGNDTYTIALGLGQGGTHDLAVGVLIDKAGNDKYQGHSTMQGSALTNAVAIFVDSRGDDLYASAGTRDQGGGSPRRGFGSIGLFLDMSGKDSYPGDDMNNCHWIRGQFGAGIDMEAFPKKD
ncbi:hypothetical protein ACFL54_06355 [Planctomycetota bacterium]